MVKPTFRKRIEDVKTTELVAIPIPRNQTSKDDEQAKNVLPRGDPGASGSDRQLECPENEEL